VFGHYAAALTLNAKPKQRHTAQRVYNRLKEQFPEFDVSDTGVSVNSCSQKPYKTLNGK
jgi:hypothetical protein